MDPAMVVVTIIFGTIGFIIVFVLIIVGLVICISPRSATEIEDTSVVEEPTKVAYVVSEQPSPSAPRVVESSEDPV
jgi:uncharacterized membrane protein